MSLSRQGHSVRGALSVFCFVLAGVFAAPAFSQNLVTNPNVNGSLPPWTPTLSGPPNPPGDGTASFNAAQDVEANAGSGSIDVQVNADGGTGTAAAEVAAVECLAIPVGQQTVTDTKYGARLRVPAGSPTDGAFNASVEVRFFSDAGCATPVEDASESQGRTLVAGVPDDAFWYDLSEPSFIPAPSFAAQSVQVRVAVTKLADTGSAVTVQFDNVYIGLNGTTPVQLQHFEVE